MEIEGFEATGALDDAVLRKLLVSERSEQRVWAAWRIALRVGAATPDIVEGVIGEPTPGVRRALLVVLAGHGENDVLLALGRHDPSADVRAAAMQLLARLAAGGTIDQAAVLDSYATDQPTIRIAVLREVARDAPSWMCDLARGSLESSTVAEQGEAFDALLRVGGPELLEAAWRWLGGANERAASEAWVRLAMLPPPEIVHLLVRSTAQLRARALAELTTIPLVELAAVAVDGDPQSFKVIRDRRDFRVAPCDVLARGILAGCAVRYVEQLTDRLAHGESLAPQRASDLRAHCIARVAAIDTDQYLPDERPTRRWPAKANYLQLLERLG